MNRQEPRYLTREEAREILTRKIESERKAQADPQSFSTIDPQYLIDDAEFRLRWIDCAPEGANHQAAPLQDKRGVPCGDCWHEAPHGLGNQAVRKARVKYGLNPFSGERLAA